MNLIDWFNCNDDTDKLGEHIKDQWTGIDEDGYSVDINTVSSGSGKKMLWRCSKGHEWVTTINSRTSSKTGCRECYSKERKSGKHNNRVKTGINDLLTWCNNNDEYGKQIINEWTGKTIDNIDISIDNITSQSNKDVYWICSKNEKHIWHTKVQKRTLLHSGCPYCCGQKTLPEESLLQYCKDNKADYIIEQFAGVDDKGNKVNIQDFTKASHAKVLWKHTTPQGDVHEWIAAISDRTYKHSGCPYCTGKNNLKPGVNDLLTWSINNNIKEELEKAWIGLDENFNSIEIDKVPYGSKTGILLQCDCGEIFVRSPLKIVYSKNLSCKKCSIIDREENRYKTIISNSQTLNDWCNEHGVYGNIIQREFTGQVDDGSTIDINNITYGSNKRVLWRHTTQQGELHEWLSVIHNRTTHKTLCPICNKQSTSLPEQIIYRCFKQIYPNTISRGKFLGYEFDIAIPELKTCIEYGSTYYHNGREQRDKEKEQLCKDYNVNFIHIVDDSSNNLEEIWTRNYIVTHIGMKKIQNIKRIVQYLFKEYRIKFNNDIYEKAVTDSINFLQKED